MNGNILYQLCQQYEENGLINIWQSMKCESVTAMKAAMAYESWRLW